MTVEEKPDVTYDDVGGCKQAKEALREVLELSLLHPERFQVLHLEPPKGVLLYGPPGTGKTLAAPAVANRTNATFIRVIGRYVCLLAAASVRLSLQLLCCTTVREPYPRSFCPKHSAN